MHILSAPSRCVYPRLIASFTASMIAWSILDSSPVLYHAVPVPYPSIGIEAPLLSFRLGIVRLSFDMVAAAFAWRYAM